LKLRTKRRNTRGCMWSFAAVDQGTLLTEPHHDFWLNGTALHSASLLRYCRCCQQSLKERRQQKVFLRQLISSAGFIAAKPWPPAPRDSVTQLRARSSRVRWKSAYRHHYIILNVCCPRCLMYNLEGDQLDLRMSNSRVEGCKRPISVTLETQRAENR
jgi:hypothetical protein